jgi:arginine/lysine/ornithine decarboxylase
MVLAGVNTCYLDAYPLHDYSMYGCVSLKRIKQALLDYKKAGKLDKYVSSFWVDHLFCCQPRSYIS